MQVSNWLENVFFKRERSPAKWFTTLRIKCCSSQGQNSSEMIKNRNSHFIVEIWKRISGELCPQLISMHCEYSWAARFVPQSQRMITYFLKGSITVQLTSRFGFSSFAHIEEIHTTDLLVWTFPIQVNRRSAVQGYFTFRIIWLEHYCNEISDTVPSVDSKFVSSNLT